MFENIISFAIGACLLFPLGVMFEESSRTEAIKKASDRFIEQGYIKAFTDQIGNDIGVPVAKCKLSGGEPVVNGKRVACLKEMKDD